jgi:hypothetical protein
MHSFFKLRYITVPNYVVNKEYLKKEVCTKLAKIHFHLEKLTLCIIEGSQSKVGWLRSLDEPREKSCDFPLDRASLPLNLVKVCDWKTSQCLTDTVREVLNSRSNCYFLVIFHYLIAKAMFIHQKDTGINEF